MHKLPNQLLLEQRNQKRQKKTNKNTYKHMHAYIWCVHSARLLYSKYINTHTTIIQMQIHYIHRYTVGFEKIYIYDFIEIYLCCVCSFRHGLTQGMKIGKKYIYQAFRNSIDGNPTQAWGKKKYF